MIDRRSQIQPTGPPPLPPLGGVLWGSSELNGEPLLARLLF